MSHVLHWQHSLHFGDVPAHLSAAIAILFGTLGWRSSRRSKRSETEATNQAVKAAQAAQDAAAAQLQIAEDFRRFANATQQRTDLATAASEAAEREPWRIERRAGNADRHLVNLTNTPKYHVYLSGQPVLPGSDRNHFREIDGGSSKRVHLFHGSANR